MAVIDELAHTYREAVLADARQWEDFDDDPA
jgi:hypothetical protein